MRTSLQPGTEPATPEPRSAKPWRTALTGLLLLATAGGLMAYGAPSHASTRSPSPQSAQEGTLVSATLLQQVSAKNVRAELAGARLAPTAPALGGGEVRYGVDAYRVAYTTVDANGRPVTATGLVALPARGPASLPVVSYDHGTTATAADVPSSFGLGPDHAVEGRWSAELFASAGFAVTEPDYVGMGEGAGPIEYLVAKSEASASADLLQAARTLAARRGGTLQRGVLVTGFSQGGQAAMALGGELQAGRGYFGLRALAPVSGPYNLLSAELPGLFNGQVAAEFQPYYVGYLLTSWNALYHLYAAPADVFRAPYAGRIAGLFNGSHQDAAVIAALPSTLSRLLTPEYLGLLRHPRGQVLRAMQANDTCAGWTPDVPVKLFAARGDTTVTQVNAEQCVRAIRARGGHAQMIQVGDVSHDVSAFVSLPQIVRWFLQLG
jgi:hypothetical protein